MVRPEEDEQRQPQQEQKSDNRSDTTSSVSQLAQPEAAAAETAAAHLDSGDDSHDNNAIPSSPIVQRDGDHRHPPATGDQSETVLEDTSSPQHSRRFPPSMASYVSSESSSQGGGNLSIMTDAHPRLGGGRVPQMQISSTSPSSSGQTSGNANNGNGSTFSSATAPTTPTASTLPTQMSTIDSIEKRPLPERRNSSDGYSSSDMMNIPPATPFFNQPFYDSDASDGSLIKRPSNRSGSNKTLQASHQKKESLSSRDRFPSFDSQGSIRYVGNSAGASGLPFAPTPQNITNVDPQLLPYAQRRKLLQQRREQQNQQQQQQQQQQPLVRQNQPNLQPQIAHAQINMQMQGAPPESRTQSKPPPDTAQPTPSFAAKPDSKQPDAAGQQSYPSAVPPNYAMQPQQPPFPPPPMYGIPPFPPPHPGFPPPQQFMHPPMGYYPPPGAMPPPPMQQMYSPQHHPMYPSPQNSDGRPSPYRVPEQYQQQQLQQPPPPPPQYRQQWQYQQQQQQQQQLRDQQQQATRPQQHQYQQEPSPTPEQKQSQAKSSNSPKTAGASKTRRRQKSSGKVPFPPPSGVLPPYNLPPSGSRGNPNAEVSHKNTQTKNQRGRSKTGQTMGDQTPLPPPPLPQQSQYHIRADSAGSVSSLGSYGMDSNREDADIENVEGAHGLAIPRAKQPRKGSDGGNGFLDMLRSSFSPRNPKGKEKRSQQQPSLSDFHRQNQAFLHRSQVQQQQQTALEAAKPSPLLNYHKRANSQERPPASRGTHKRLTSINDDDWEDQNRPIGQRMTAEGGEMSSESGVDAHSEVTDGDDTHDEEVNEATSLLPPTGISTNERDAKVEKKRSEDRNQRSRRSATKRSSKQPSASSRQRQLTPDSQSKTVQWNNNDHSDKMEEARLSPPPRKTKKKKSNYRRRSNRNVPSDSDSSRDSADHDYREWTRKRAKMLEKERAKLILQWKAEAFAEAEALRKSKEENKWHRRVARHLDAQFGTILSSAFRVFAATEAFIANLPLTIGAIAMAIVTLGVVWFKFAEENLDSCEPVHFHSSQCTFPEFPGCFYCDTSAGMYRMALYFHLTCKSIAGFMSMLFILKILLATRVVLDEMSSPTTASPAGLLCMTIVCVFAGRGAIGQIMVSIAACVHLGLVIWFIYMCLAYHIMPEPSWFPNTIGIGLSAVKTWLYYPMPGHLLMAISLSLNLFFFPISLVRVFLNQKISATVGWMQMSAPAIALYSLTIMAQPSFEEEHPDVTDFQKVHRMVYLPCMHVMCGFSILGFVASVTSLVTRWNDFKSRPFSPAHAAFCFPVLSHANSVQAYRGAIHSFSDIDPRSFRMAILYAYWCAVLAGGTIATFWITAKFLYCLPEWTNLDLDDEEEPPAPYETMMSLQDMVTAGESLRQPFVSPAVLQANETGALVLTRSRQDGRQRYVRTRRLLALGFEPTMNWSEIQQERELLLEWVGKNPPKRRHRTLSVPGVDFRYGGPSSFGTGNIGVYGAITPTNADTSSRRRRADTGSPRMFFGVTE